MERAPVVSFHSVGMKWVRSRGSYWGCVDPLRLTMSLIESKWKSCILDELRDGLPMRPSEVHRSMPEAAPRVIDIQLKEMVEDGLVVKTIFPELPPRSEYRVTPLGESLLPIIDAMMQWGGGSL